LPCFVIAKFFHVEKSRFLACFFIKPTGAQGGSSFFLLLPAHRKSSTIRFKEKFMPQTMTLDEKLAISNKACALWEAGDKEGYDRLTKTIPLPPYLAKVIKEKVSLDVLLNGGWNLSEVEAEFGRDWLSK
jgi:hypothetical protein